MDLDRFTLDGVPYWQEMRACGVRGCRCEDGELHGPYWYKRVDGRVKYVGKHLPDSVVLARVAHEQLAGEMRVCRDGYIQRAADMRRIAGVLGTLADGGAVADGDLPLLEELGFLDAVVDGAVRVRIARKPKYKQSRL
jgi:hypothetical protein